MKIKKLYLTISLVACIVLQSEWLFAQAPPKVSYQMVVRNASCQLVKESPVGTRLSILQGSASGSAVYVETHTIQSNVNGLVSLEVGGGTYTGSSFADIDWADGPYYLKVETDPAGGSNYIFYGNSQINSVPFALHAKTADSLTGSIKETDPRVPDGTTQGEMQYWNGTVWTTLIPGSEGQIMTMVNGRPVWFEDPHNTDVTNPVTGETWKDRNLGAGRVALSSTDEEAYGDLYQWGRGSDGHQLRTSPTTTTLSAANNPEHGDFILASEMPYAWQTPIQHDLWQGIFGINNPCPSGYRIPTSAEWEAEIQTWASNDNEGAFNSPLKLTLAGWRRPENGSLEDVGFVGSYWSSTLTGTYDITAYYLSISSSSTNIWGTNYSYGNTVRCIKD